MLEFFFAVGAFFWSIAVAGWAFLFALTGFAFITLLLYLAIAHIVEKVKKMLDKRKEV